MEKIMYYLGFAEGWSTGLVKCDLCGHEWIAVFPSGLDRLECPHCQNLAGFDMLHGK